jgi:hypothetical protein
MLLLRRSAPGARELVRVEVDHERDGAWFGFVAGASRSLTRFPYDAWTIVVEPEPNTRGLAEITADLAASLEARSLAGMARGATDLAALSGEQLAALTLCIPVVSYALRTLPPSGEEHGRARTAAAAILNLTGIDPSTEV